MNNQSLGWAGVALIGVVAGLGLPKILSRMRQAARQATGTTFKTATIDSGARPAADPARGYPA